MALGPRVGKTEEPVEQPPKIEDARASLLRVLHENEELENELIQVREGNLRAAQILIGPLPPPQPGSRCGAGAGGDPLAVATASGGRPPDPHQPPPPQPEPPKRPRPDDD